MSRTKTTSVFLSLLLLAAGCTLTGGSLPSAEEMGPASATDADDLRRGRASVVRNCTACHRMFWPEEFPPKAWESIGPDMSERAGMARDEAESVTRYLVAASRWSRTAPPEK